MVALYFLYAARMFVNFWFSVVKDTSLDPNGNDLPKDWVAPKAAKGSGAGAGKKGKGAGKKDADEVALSIDVDGM